MALGYEFPVITTGNLQTAIDTYASTISTQPPINTPSNPNGALNPAGAAFLLAPGKGQGTNGADAIYGANGWGAPLIVRYVRYNSTTNANLLAYPAPVYWTDETFTTVTGTFSEGIGAGTGTQEFLAGLLLPNYTALGLTAANAAKALNGNWCFIATKGFLPGVYVPGSTAIGSGLVGGTGNFTYAAQVAAGTYPGATPHVRALTAISGGVADVLIDCDITF